MPYTGYYKFLEPAVNLRDPDLIKDVLIKDHFSFHINEIRFDEKADPLMSLNPFGAIDDTWRKARNVLTPLLTLFKVIFLLLQAKLIIIRAKMSVLYLFNAIIFTPFE